MNRAIFRRAAAAPALAPPGRHSHTPGPAAATPATDRGASLGVLAQAFVTWCRRSHAPAVAAPVTDLAAAPGTPAPALAPPGRHSHTPGPAVAAPATDRGAALRTLARAIARSGFCRALGRAASLGALAAVALAAATPARAEVRIQEVVSPGGITAWLVEEHSIPFTALQLAFRGGASLDAPGRRGAINLMTGLLEEGAGELDSLGFAAAQERLAARFGFSVGDEALTVSARFLSENRDEAVDLLRQALVETRFDEAAIARVKGQVAAGIRADATDPPAIARKAFARLAWGDHPYGSDSSGTLDSLAALGRDDLIAARDRVIARDRLFVGVVGDITPDELGPLLDHLLGDLPAEGAPMPPAARWQLPPGVQVVPFETPQSVAVFGTPGLPLHDPDYFAAYVLTEAVGGGGFSSTLMEELRQKRGLTYGVGAGLASRDLGDSLQGSFAASNALMGQALGVLEQVWAEVAANGIPDAQLRDTKTYLTGAYPLRFDGNGTIASILAGMQLNGFPIDYIRTRNARVEAVTQEDIRRVARRLFRPEALGIVVVGQPEGVETTMAP